MDRRRPSVDDIRWRSSTRTYRMPSDLVRVGGFNGGLSPSLRQRLQPETLELAGEDDGKHLRSVHPPPLPQRVDAGDVVRRELIGTLDARAVPGIDEDVVGARRVEVDVVERADDEVAEFPPPLLGLDEPFDEIDREVGGGSLPARKPAGRAVGGRGV